MKRTKQIPNATPAVAAPPAPEAARLSSRAIVVALSAAVAGWIAAGAVGYLTDPLRHALTYAALAVLFVAALPTLQWRRDGLWTAAALIAAAALLMPAAPAVNLAAPVVLVALAARGALGRERRVFAAVASALTVMLVYLLAVESSAFAWHAAALVGGGLGRLGGWLSGTRLTIGPTFAALEAPVFMFALTAVWLPLTAAPRRRRALLTIAAIIVAQLIYLGLLARAADLVALLPAAPIQPESDINFVRPWSFNNALRALVPWNLPAVALLLQAMILAAMLRLPRWNSGSAPVESRRDQRQPAGGEWPALATSVLLAAALPIASRLSEPPAPLADKQLLLFDDGAGRWLPPSHDEPALPPLVDGRAPRRYGLLPRLVEGWGGRCPRSTDLAASDLQTADAVLIVDPTGTWPEDRQQRLWNYVRDGGTLIVAASSAGSGSNAAALDALLAPADLAFQRNRVVPAAPRWERSTQTLPHGATGTRLADWSEGRHTAGLIAPAALATGPSATPLVIGRYAFAADTDAANSAAPSFVAGAPLGDQILAAERRVGHGRVIVLGDSNPLADDELPSDYPQVVRLLSHALAPSANDPQTPWRQGLALLLAAALVAMLLHRPAADRGRAAGGQELRRAVAIAVALAGTTLLAVQSQAATPLLPSDNPSSRAAPIAWIDASHAEAFSDNPADEDGLAQFTRTLARDGLLPLVADDLRDERLQTGDLVVLIAPLRRFSQQERAALDDFVRSGGRLICMVGAEDAAASRALLEDFRLRVPPSPAAIDQAADEPMPLGALRSLYLKLNDFEPMMHLFAGWPVECLARPFDVLKFEPQGRTVIVRRRFGGGNVTLIGDSLLAVNRNMETAEGRPSENALFWRWLLSQVRGPQEWQPPRELVTAEEVQAASLPPEELEESDAEILEPSQESPPAQAPPKEAGPSANSPPQGAAPPARAATTGGAAELSDLFDSPEASQPIEADGKESP